MAKNNISSAWKFADIWNNTLDSIQDRPLVPRDYIYASELGGAFCDRYLKMYGVKQTNPPNTRSMRKFQAGNMWEWVLGMVFTSSGILKHKQLKCELTLPKMLRVSGRLDFIAGGDVDWSKAKSEVSRIKDALAALNLEVPPFFFSAIDKFVDEYTGRTLNEVVMEAKSVSSFMMEKLQKTNEPMPHHVLQNFHYILSNKMNEGKLVYVCKDDCILAEFPVYNNEETLAIYKDDIKKMTKFYKAGFNTKKPTELMPPLEPQVLFEDGVWRFSKNFKVEYSGYLKMLYGYETPEAYRMAWQYKLTSWNRVFKRFVRGENITPKNNEVRADAIKTFPLWDKYVAKAKAAGAFQKSEEDEDDQ